MVLEVADEPIELAPLAEADRPEWARFLEASDNGCLFHDLDFLAYHPEGRFRFHHLVARQRGKVIALVPGGLAGDAEHPVFTSPLGASVGGPVIGPRTRTAQGIALVTALQDHARANGWAGVRMTIAPPVYTGRTQDLLSFALFARGFRLEHRWNCYMVPIRRDGTDRYATLFRDSQASLVRAARRRGVVANEGGLELLEDFLPLFADTYSRHGVAATHTPEEIVDLLRRFPRRISLVIARKEDTPVGGVLVMRLNARVAYTFYICASTAHAEERGNLVVFAALLDTLAAEGVGWLDTGPSAWDGNYNAGGVYFKEGIGATGHCRDRWTWNA